VLDGFRSDAGFSSQKALGEERRIPLYVPDLSGNERRYVLQCLDTSWISSNGEFITRFERSFAELSGIPFAVAVANGTVALHLALHCLGVGPGDEVIVPTFTYIASVNAIVQTGAVPVFAECRRDDWLLDPDDVARKITARTRAIMPVHLYGAVCDMHALRRCADAYGIAIVEDCAEAFGATLDALHVGGFGQIGTFSFYGNKTITTGEGGMVVTRDAALAARLRRVKGQGQSEVRRYWHTELGFNYRMTNVCAAIGLAQLEHFEAIANRKRAVFDHYRRLLANLPVTLQKPLPGVQAADWLFTLLLAEGTDRDGVMEWMGSQEIETRPSFYCAHQMPMYDNMLSFPVSEDVSRRGLSLPSYPGMREEDVVRVVAALREALAQHTRNADRSPDTAERLASSGRER
jgi:perosamine synthetase